MDLLFNDLCFLENIYKIFFFTNWAFIIPKLFLSHVDLFIY